MTRRTYSVLSIARRHSMLFAFLRKTPRFVTEHDLRTLPDGASQSADHLAHVYEPFADGARYKCAGIATRKAVEIVESRTVGAYVTRCYVCDQMTAAEMHACGMPAVHLLTESVTNTR